MRGEIGEGLRYVLRNRYLRSIAACTGSANFFESMILAILVLYAVRVLDMSPGVIGLTFAVGNAGAVVGAFLSGFVPRWFGIGPAIILGAITFAPPVILIPLAPKSFPLPFLIVSLALTAAGGVVYNVNNVGLRQAITPLRMQGRMNATMRFIVWGTMPLGALVGGTLGGVIGLRPTLFVAAIPGTLTFLPVLLSPLRKLREIPAVSADEQPPREPVVPATVPVQD
jgi:MFS family permease